MTEDAAVTLHVGSISIFCDATFYEKRVRDLTEARHRALENWSDIVDLLRSIDASPVVELSLSKGEILGLIHSGDATATAISLPMKATAYDVLAKILRELEHSMLGTTLRLTGAVGSANSGAGVSLVRAATAAPRHHSHRLVR